MLFRSHILLAKQVNVPYIIVFMNPVDHPHGGRTRGGRNVVSPWGKKEGVKTRNKKKSSQRMIVRGRKRGKATQ